MKPISCCRESNFLISRMALANSWKADFPILRSRGSPVIHRWPCGHKRGKELSLSGGIEDLDPHVVHSRTINSMSLRSTRILRSTGTVGEDCAPVRYTSRPFGFPKWTTGERRSGWARPPPGASPLPRGIGVRLGKFKSKSYRRLEVEGPSATATREKDALGTVAERITLFKNAIEPPLAAYA